jgi:hypothetical protein
MWREFMPNTNSYGGSFTIPKQLHVDELSFTADLLTIYASTTDLAAECPLCGQPSLRIHGCYMRTLADLPWCGTPVRLRVRVRKFFCDEPSCERRIFAERLDEVARVHARATDRQREALEWIALALGGEAGARLARELGLLVSPDTLLNRIRGAFCADGANNVVRVLGVDDFGLGRDGLPGTIMVDLERHRIVDLLKEHSVESLAKWLSEHPNVEVVSRDRSHICREAIAAGAPQATQIADRWHLLRNLAEKLDEFLGQKRPILEAAARPPTQPETEGDEDSLPEGSVENLYEDPGAPGPLTPDRPRPGYAHRQQVSRKHYELVVKRWQEIRRLHKAGADALPTSPASSVRAAPRSTATRISPNRRSLASIAAEAVSSILGCPTYLNAGRKAAATARSSSERFENKATPTASPMWDAWSPSSGEQMG